MQYRAPVSDHSCHDGAVRPSATLMTRPHAGFAHHSILGVRIRCFACRRYSPVGRTVHASRGAAPMPYRSPVSDHSCHDGAARTSATLMTRPHAAFAQPGIVWQRVRCFACLRYTRQSYGTVPASRRATPMQYRWPVSDHSCHDGAVRTSATLMTRPHAAFAQPGIVRVRIRSCECLQYPTVGRTERMRAIEQLRCNTAGL